MACGTFGPCAFCGLVLVWVKVKVTLIATCKQMIGLNVVCFDWNHVFLFTYYSETATLTTGRTRQKWSIKAMPLSGQT